MPCTPLTLTCPHRRYWNQLIATGFSKCPSPAQKPIVTSSWHTRKLHVAPVCGLGILLSSAPTRHIILIPFSHLLISASSLRRTQQCLLMGLLSVSCRHNAFWRFRFKGHIKVPLVKASVLGGPQRGETKTPTYHSVSVTCRLENK